MTTSRYRIEVKFIGGGTLPLSSSDDYGECVQAIKRFVNLQREYFKASRINTEMSLHSQDGYIFQVMRFNTGRQYAKAGLAMVIKIIDKETEPEYPHNTAGQDPKIDKGPWPAYDKAE